MTCLNLHNVMLVGLFHLKIILIYNEKKAKISKKCLNIYLCKTESNRVKFLAAYCIILGSNNSPDKKTAL